MNQDPHLGTGCYDPQVYWSARARKCTDQDLEAVCVFGASETENRCADRVQRRILSAALRSIDLDGKRVLEYGCGIGRWAPFFERRGSAWSGVDISQKMLAVAGEQLSSEQLSLLDGDTIPHPDKSFDLVYSVTVIHHNEYSHQERILAEMRRVLRDDGVLLLYEDLGERGSFNMYPRSQAGWIELAEKQGMSCLWARGARYWILRSAASALLGRFRKADPRPQGATAAEARTQKRTLLHNLLARIDLALDPYLLPLLPSRYHRAAGMLFGPRQSN